jgi:hypothetical protein
VEIWVLVASREASPEELPVELLVAAQELNQRLEAEVRILLEMSRSVRIELDDDLVPLLQPGAHL